MATVSSQHAPLHPIVGDRLIAGDGTSAQDWQAWQGLDSLTRLDIPTHFSTHRRVCIFAPHPDDEIFWAVVACCKRWWLKAIKY